MKRMMFLFVLMLMNPLTVMAQTIANQDSVLGTFLGLTLILVLILALIGVLPKKKKPTPPKQAEVPLEMLIKQRIAQLNQANDPMAINVLPLEKGGAFDTYLMLTKKQQQKMMKAN